MKAIFEIQFDMNDMFDAQSLKEEWSNDALAAMKWLYDQDGLGIFNEELTLIEVNSVTKTAKQ